MHNGWNKQLTKVHLYPHLASISPYLRYDVAMFGLLVNQPTLFTPSSSFVSVLLHYLVSLEYMVVEAQTPYYD